MMFRLGLMATSVFALVACGTTSTPSASGGSASASMATADSAATYGKEGAYSFPAELGEAGKFSVFEPKPTGRTSQIDYFVLSEALDIMVFQTGPSLRTVAPPRDKALGSRFVKGHDSPLRLEGNKIFFSQFDKDTIESFADYRNSLIDIGNRIDVTTLSRNEQLAYWLNLHNVLVIDTIMSKYPVRVPVEMKLGPDRKRFNEATLATIRGVDLSLNDIRQNIVYRYWDDPRVMYGFFHGDLGSPNIVDKAYTGDNVANQLNSNAREFVNSLRGVRAGSNTIYVSKHYFEARAGLFPDWPSDLKNHLSAFANDEVSLLLMSKPTITGAQYEDRTADMVGGDPRLDIQAGPTTIGMSPQMQELAIETGEKLLELRRQGKLRSRVIIVDLPDGMSDVPEELSAGEIE